MGLIQAGLGAIAGNLADQWKEYFYCEALPADVLVTKGVKRTGGRSSNTKGTKCPAPLPRCGRSCRTWPWKGHWLQPLLEPWPCLSALISAPDLSEPRYRGLGRN